MNGVDWALSHEDALRLGAFLGVLGLLLVAERLAPFRGDARAGRRQARNTALVAIDTALLRLAFPVLAVAWAAGMQTAGVGLFALTAWPWWLEVVLAVMVFEVVLAAGSLFTHADFAFSPRVDRVLRWLLVTPSMHRIHHSVIRQETDSNYGFHLSLWDRLFGSYRAQPQRDPRTMPIGLERFREEPEQSLGALLLQPFKAGDLHA